MAALASGAQLDHNPAKVSLDRLELGQSPVHLALRVQELGGLQARHVSAKLRRVQQREGGGRSVARGTRGSCQIKPAARLEVTETEHAVQSASQRQQWLLECQARSREA